MGADDVEVMVADRGTQTAVEISTQTDPDAHTVSCPMCYEAFFGHPPPEDGCLHMPPAHAFPAAAYAAAGVPGVVPPVPLPFQPLRHPPVGSGLGVGLFRGVPHLYQSPSTTAAYQLQIDAILSQIDGIISKHNLPPMPL